MFALIKLLFGLAIIIGATGFARTWQLEHSDEQNTFVGGATTQKPDGQYQGSVRGYSGSWVGKKFDATNSRGVNVFTNGSTTSERYPFSTSVGSGLRDTQLQVIKIDYNVPENPFWLKPILDEIVETSPDHYLGKMQLRLIPGYPFTFVFFTLQK